MRTHVRGKPGDVTGALRRLLGSQTNSSCGNSPGVHCMLEEGMGERAVGGVKPAPAPPVGWLVQAPGG
jgi:hypothetical protein